MNTVMLRRLYLITVFAFLPITARGQWMELNTGTADDIRTILANDAVIFTGTDSGRVLRSTDAGDTWTACDSGLPFPARINSFAQNGKYVFLASTTGLYRSDDNGSSWDVIDPGDGMHAMWSLCASGSTVAAGGYPGSVCISTDSGSTWHAVDTSEFPGVKFGEGRYIQSLVIYDSKLFAGFFGGGLFTAPLNGQSWISVQVDDVERNTPICLMAKGSTLYLGTDMKGVYRSTDSGMTWSLHQFEGSIWQLAHNDGTLFAITSAHNSGGVYYAEEDAANWTQSTIEVPDGDFLLALAVTPTWVFTGGSQGTIWRAPLSDFTSIRERRHKKEYRQTLRLQVYGNGIAETTISFTMPVSQKTEVTVFDFSGTCVTKLFDGIAPAGTHLLSWNTNSLASGHYIVRLQGETGKSVKSFVRLQ